MSNRTSSTTKFHCGYSLGIRGIHVSIVGQYITRGIATDGAVAYSTILSSRTSVVIRDWCFIHIDYAHRDGFAGIEIACATIRGHHIKAVARFCFVVGTVFQGHFTSRAVDSQQARICTSQAVANGVVVVGAICIRCSRGVNDRRGRGVLIDRAGVAGRDDRRIVVYVRHR